MTEGLLVASANVLSSLGRGQAREVLGGVLDAGPDLVGLQEWYPTRIGLLRETGAVSLVPARGSRRRPAATGYLWCAPLLGGCAVGARADRFDLLGCRPVLLSRPGRADKPDRPLGVEPPRVATLTTYLDRRTSLPVSLICYHLVPGVQAHGRYRPERPLLVARHRAEVRRLQRVVDAELGRGRQVYAVGDANLDGLRLGGLTSAWEGRAEHPGTLGARKVDDVHGPGPAGSVTRLVNHSDHRAVLAHRP